MIELRLKELMNTMGIRSHYKTLQRLGIGQSVVQRVLTGKQHTLKVQHIEKFCTLLRCTPNDLFVWTPDQPADDYPENPMQAIRKKELSKLDEVVGKLTFEQVQKKLGGGEAGNG